jgi:hypothetical protein
MLSAKTAPRKNRQSIINVLLIMKKKPVQSILLRKMNSASINLNTVLLFLALLKKGELNL